MSLAAQQRREYNEWVAKWGELRAFDKAICDTIDREHCRAYCGIVKHDTLNHADCTKHHDTLYREYLKQLDREELADIFIREFRWGSLL